MNFDNQFLYICNDEKIEQRKKKSLQEESKSFYFETPTREKRKTAKKLFRKLSS